MKFGSYAEMDVEFKLNQSVGGYVRLFYFRWEMFSSFVF